ncbi:MAG: sterol desaturase family protein [Balneolaceae bacterium]|jgi:sterol desaturase/sphingolipid hydroxylase (fatty acid hydroxylase superfamily)
MKKKIKNKGQGRIFNNSFLEYMTKAPAPVSATLYIAILVGLLYYGYVNGVVETLPAGVALFVGAMFFWTFFEYFFHRYINHLDEYFPNSELAKKIAFTIHGIHHEYPRDRERLIMPPIPGLLIAAVLYLGYLILLGNLVYVFMPGFMTGYLCYTYVHIRVHKPNVPSFLQSQYRHHALHHYKYPEKAFGVSTTLWDHVFGTMPPKG